MKATDFLALFCFCASVTAANLPPRLPKDVWNRLTENIREQAREQWANSPMDEQGQWSQWLFQHPISPPPSSPVAFKENSEDPFLSPAIIEEDFTPFFKDPSSYGPPPPLQEEQQLDPIYEGADDVLNTVSNQAETSGMTQASTNRARGTPRGRKAVYDEKRQHACYLCGKSFQRAEHCKRHLNTVHSDDKPFPCSVCGKGFSRVDNRDAHLKTHEDQSK